MCAANFVLCFLLAIAAAANVQVRPRQRQGSGVRRPPRGLVARLGPGRRPALTSSPALLCEQIGPVLAYRGHPVRAARSQGDTGAPHASGQPKRRPQIT